MDCPHCGQEYKPSQLPRILTQCGHTTCESCLNALFAEKAVICCQCKRTTLTEEVANLPVNLALMHLRDGQSHFCAVHSKPMEAFCTTDQEMICVGCILEESHKRHDITSISKAASHLRTSLLSSLLSTAQLSHSLHRKEKELAALEASLRQEHASIAQSGSELFALVTAVVREKEAEMMEKLNTTFAMELERIRTIREANGRQEAALVQFQREIAGIDAETDAVVLGKGREREELVRCANVKPLSLVQSKPFAGFNREGELNALWKGIRARAGLGTSTPVPASPLVKPISPIPKPDPKRLPPSKPKDSSPIFPPDSHPGRTKSQSKDPLRTSVTLMKSKTVITFKPEQDDGNISMDSYVQTEINSSISGGFKGDFSPISKASASFLSLEDDLVSAKSLDLSTFCTTRSASIFTFGGFSDRALSCVERFDPVTEEWRAVAQLPSVRCQFACFQRPQRITLLGGKVAGKRVATSDDFLIPTSHSVEGGMRLSGIRSGFGCAVLQECVYIAGGSDGVPLKSMEIWTGVEWSLGASMKVRRDELALVAGPDLQLYAIGGYGGPDM